MSIIVWVVALVALFFIARAWLSSRDDDERIADLVPPPHGTPLETLVWPVVGETQLNDDHSSRQQALAQCSEGMPVEIEFHDGGQGASGTARVKTRFGEIGTLRNDALTKLHELAKQHKRFEAYIRELEGGTEEHAIRSATLQIYVYDE
jgi:hypothetical protein